MQRERALCPRTTAQPNMHLFIALRRILAGLVSGVEGVLTNAAVFLVDFAFTLFNLVTPNRRKGRVILEGHPGFGGKWPEYIPPREGDSRSSCPALNAMANHGLLPRDGKNIKFTELNAAIRRVYNFSPTFCFFVPNYIANALVRSYRTDRFDLSDIDAHNCIEHDASLTRVDSYADPDQGKIAKALVEEVLNSGTGPGGDLTPDDLSRLLGKRRVEAKRQNPKFSLAFIHKMFGSSNGSTMLTIFGGRVQDLRPILSEERLPDGWEPRVRHRMGLTMLEFNFTVLPVELSIKEEVDGSIGSAGQERYEGAGKTEKAE
ncbi:Cloroperoxidase [Trametes coccinea BRFM310]|uniref:Cloroperoxidase n=1 Tax=Trametes coccinea (strain BRFM310) TaxID=1353009 RepID=A0A1Y2IEY1_TRAC3|nr:Cloroperoxidase [Trametes coccinea BRFM310]